MAKDGWERNNKMNYMPVFKNPMKYADAKIDILRHEFCLPLTGEDEEYVRSFKTEYSIDSACKALINKYWS